MNKLISLFIYLSAFGISLLIAKVYQNRFFYRKQRYYFLKKAIWCLLIITPPVIISSIRYNVGTDYQAYVRIFKQINFVKFSRIWPKYINEPLYFVLNKVAYFLFEKPLSIFFLSSFLIHLFIIFGIDFFKDKISIPIALFVYYSMHFAFGLNGIRQMIAMSIVFFSLRYIYKKELLKYFLFIIIATMFHNSAAICLFFYLLVNIRYKKYNLLKNIIYYFSILLTPLITNFFLNLLLKIDLFSSYSHYLINDIDLGVGFLLHILPIIIPIFIFKKSIIYKNKFFEPIINLSLLNIPFKYVGYFSNWGGRLSLYTNMLYYILVPLVISSVRNRANKIVLINYYIIFFMYFYLFKFFINNHSETFPFTTMIFHNLGLTP
ncbi:EpsG family protein [Halanaerobaculum tunisiense]